MQIDIIDPKEYVTTNWDGGTTTQLYILPTGLTVSDDFTFRISSATVQSGESTFSDFSGYKRFLTVLKGEMFIKVGDATEEYITKLTPVFFDGAVPTSSRCSDNVVDFNIIWKNTLGSVDIGIVSGCREITCQSKLFFYATGQSHLTVNGNTQQLNQGQLIVVDAAELDITIQGEGVYCSVSTI